MSENIEEENFKFKQMFDGSHQLEQKLPDGSSQLVNFNKDTILIENEKGVNSFDLEKNHFHLRTITNIDTTKAIKEEERMEDGFKVIKYYFDEESWVEVTLNLDGSVKNQKASHVKMSITDNGTKLIYSSYEDL